MGEKLSEICIIKIKEMKSVKIMLLATMLGSATACSQQKEKIKMEQSSFNENQEVIDTAYRLTDLMIDRNIEAIDSLLDDKFTLTHITGYVQPKGEWLREIEQESMKYYSYEIVSEKVEISGNKAIFIGQNILDARIWGTRNRWRLQQKVTMEKRNGKWVIINSVASIF